MIGSAAPTRRLPSRTSWGQTWCWPGSGRFLPRKTEQRRKTFQGAVSSLGQRADHRGVRLALETGTEAGQRLKTFLDALDMVSLAASIDPASLLRAGIDPVAVARELSTWVAHAYAGDATGSTAGAAPNPRGFGYPAGALDWEEYLGVLEEIAYRGFLTVWPDPSEDAVHSIHGNPQEDVKAPLAGITNSHEGVRALRR